MPTNLATGVITNNEPIASPGAVSAAFAALSHDRPNRTGKFAAAVATGGVVATLQAVLITGANNAWIVFEELTVPRLAARSAPARVEDRTFLVCLARFDATLASTTLVPLQAIDDRLDTQTIDTHIRDAGIIMLAATVPMRLTWSNTELAGTCLIFCAVLWAH
jgi:hypothetical protein